MRLLLFFLVMAAAWPIRVLNEFYASNLDGSDHNEKAEALLGMPVLATSVIPKKTSLILHVGLPKTATSSVQCTLARLEQNGLLSEVASAKILEVESCRTPTHTRKIQIERYLEQFPFVSQNEIYNQEVTETSQRFTTYKQVIQGLSALQHCLDVWVKHHNSVPDCWKMSYQKYIRNYARHGYSTFIISNENLALTSLGTITEPETCGVIFNDMLNSLGEGSEIQIILTQRLHYERMKSMFREQYDGNKFYSRPKLQKWLEDGGGEVPFLENYIRDFRIELLERAMSCFRFASRNPRISFKVLDFNNQEQDIVTSFLDEITRDDNLTEQLSKAGTAKENAGSSKLHLIDYDRIALAAMKAGLIDISQLSRKDARNAVSGYFAANGLSQSDMILKCPPDDFFDDLARTTVMVQEMSFPNETRYDVKDRLQMFRSKSFQRQFCEVDAHATLYSEAMHAFVQQLESQV